MLCCNSFPLTFSPCSIYIKRPQPKAKTPIKWHPISQNSVICETLKAPALREEPRRQSTVCKLCKISVPLVEASLHVRFEILKLQLLKNIVTASQTRKLHLDFPLCLTSDWQEIVFKFPWQMKITLGLRLPMDSLYHWWGWGEEKKGKIFRNKCSHTFCSGLRTWGNRWWFCFIIQSMKDLGFRTKTAFLNMRFSHIWTVTKGNCSVLHSIS